jgi:hypothetical protein
MPTSCTLAHLHVLGVRLLHHHLDVDLGGVGHVLLRLNVDLVDEAAGVDVVDGVLAIVNVVVLPLLLGQVKGKGKNKIGCLAVLGKQARHC